MCNLHAIPQDKTLKCSVFRIKGIVPVNSYIMVPKTSRQSLGLTGRYFYLLFRPTPGKYFVAHLDVTTKVLFLILFFDTGSMYIIHVTKSIIYVCMYLLIHKSYYFSKSFYFCFSLKQKIKGGYVLSFFICRDA